MPPFMQSQSPAPLGIPPLQEPEGMNSQIKKVILFAIIFSVLTASVLFFMFFKPGSGTKNQEISLRATTTGASMAGNVPINAPQKKFSLSSLFNFSFFKAPMITSKTSSTGKSSTSTAKKSAPKTTTTKKTTTKTTKTAATTTTSVPTKELVGIYGEPLSAEDQLQLQFHQIDLPSSGLRGKIWISAVKRSTKANQEYVTLTTAKDFPIQTTITGMTIKSIVTGQTVQVGKGVGIPIPNEVNTPTDIFPEPNGKILVTTGSSPLGYSFRTNLCIGYFEQFQDFSPSLSSSCPVLKETKRPAPPNHLQDACIDYINKVPKCKIITSLPKSTSDILNDEQEYRCLTFIQDNTGYQNCVDEHKYDKKFYGSEWRTYLNWSSPIWKSKREIIWLLDQQGNFVSQFSY